MSVESTTEIRLPPEHDVSPCKYMEGMVSGYADGSLRGPARWYTHLHSLHCKQCDAAIKNLRGVIEKVADLREDSRRPVDEAPAERRSGIERALDEVDAASKGTS